MRQKKASHAPARATKKKQKQLRAPHALSQMVDERVKHVEDLMRRAKWERGRSNRQLAAAWGLTVTAVNHYAAEASRRVRAEVTDPDSVQFTICGALQTIVREGLEESDRSSVIKAADVWSRVSGARAPDKLDVHEVDPFHGMTPKQKAAWCRERVAQLLEMAKDFDAEAGLDTNCEAYDLEEED